MTDAPEKRSRPGRGKTGETPSPTIFCAALVSTAPHAPAADSADDSWRVRQAISVAGPCLGASGWACTQVGAPWAPRAPTTQRAALCLRAPTARDTITLAQTGPIAVAISAVEGGPGAPAAPQCVVPLDVTHFDESSHGLPGRSRAHAGGAGGGDDDDDTMAELMADEEEEGPASGTRASAPVRPIKLNGTWFTFLPHLTVEWAPPRAHAAHAAHPRPAAVAPIAAIWLSLLGLHGRPGRVGQTWAPAVDWSTWLVAQTGGRYTPLPPVHPDPAVALSTALRKGPAGAPTIPQSHPAWQWLRRPLPAPLNHAGWFGVSRVGGAILDLYNDHGSRGAPRARGSGAGGGPPLPEGVPTWLMEYGTWAEEIALAAYMEAMPRLRVTEVGTVWWGKPHPRQAATPDGLVTDDRVTLGWMRQHYPGVLREWAQHGVSPATMDLSLGLVEIKCSMSSTAPPASALVQVQLQMAAMAARGGHPRAWCDLVRLTSFRRTSSSHPSGAPPRGGWSKSRPPQIRVWRVWYSPRLVAALGRIMGDKRTLSAMADPVARGFVPGLLSEPEYATIPGEFVSAARGMAASDRGIAFSPLPGLDLGAGAGGDKRRRPLPKAPARGYPLYDPLQECPMARWARTWWASAVADDWAADKHELAWAARTGGAHSPRVGALFWEWATWAASTTFPPLNATSGALRHGSAHPSQSAWRVYASLGASTSKAEPTPWWIRRARRWRVHLAKQVSGAVSPEEHAAAWAPEPGQQQLAEPPARAGPRRHTAAPGPSKRRARPAHSEPEPEPKARPRPAKRRALAHVKRALAIAGQGGLDKAALLALEQARAALEHDARPPGTYTGTGPGDGS